MKRKVRVGLIFGGRSGEHTVSLASANSVLRALDPERYEAVPIGITREGQWLIAESGRDLLANPEVTLELPDTAEAMLDVTHHGIIPVNHRGGIDRHDTAVDVCFPLLHGPNGEDGTLQGLLELADLPYVGSGVFASAASMDKGQMKRLFRDAGLPQVPWVTLRGREWERDADGVVARIEAELSYPVFVKPCNLGSSVGITKAVDGEALRASIAVALAHDRRVIVEQGVDAREVEVGVLGNDEPLVSVPGEVIPHNEFYDYESKYTDGLADLIIPARISDEQRATINEIAVRAFETVDAAGLARVDFFIRRSDGAILLNEINTIPGFTQTSMYPKLWEASGVPYPELIGRLIQFAIDRHRDKPSR
ncbi:MAG TPA: D-alanine--D-alanine ligase [Chloroflexota bacterium]|nr:D-alanine--D-alanine ligase [Chloroflexota bacterium]